jgi:predicted negative regulator of RcsB-dependent stress response
LKHDRFVEQVGQTVEFASEHRQQFVRYGTVAVAVLVIALGVYWYMRYSASQRQDALRQAVHIQEGQVGEQQNPYFVTFKTEEEKRQAVQKSWTELANKYSGSAEANIAHYYMGVNAADQGNLPEAEKHLKQVADSGKDAYASQAKLSLAQIYQASGRTAEAEKLLRSLVDDPTVMVSKEQATIALASVLAKNNPAEARKLLEPLRGSQRAPVSRAAISMLSEIPAR